jgi:hypothetical protein
VFDAPDGQFHLHAAQPLDHAAAGAHAAERPLVRGDRPGPGRARAARSRPRRGPLRAAFRLALARAPQDAELARLQRLLTEQRASFAADAAGAAAFATGPAPVRGARPAEVAAWTAVSRVLMNTDEFITRE